MKSESDKLRALLDERGKKHMDVGDMTFFYAYGVKWCAQEQHDGMLHVQAMSFLTAERVIQAVIGAD